LQGRTRPRDDLPETAVPRRLRLVLSLLLLAPLAQLPGGCGEPPGNEGAPRRTYDPDGRLLGGSAAAAKGPRLNLVLILIDTLRADACDAHAEGGGAMPYFASLARTGVNFRQASAPAPWTLPSLMSLMTSRLPHEHGVHGNDLVLPRLNDLTTWPEILTHLGYDTAAFVSQKWPNARAGMLQGFAHVDEHFALRASSEILAPWVEKRNPTRPFFLFLHTYEAHDPYGEANHPWPRPPADQYARAIEELSALGPQPPTRDLVRRMVLDDGAREALRREVRFRAWQADTTRYLWSGLRTDDRQDLAAALAGDLRRAYVDGTTWVDAQLRTTVEFLQAARLLENTLLIVTSDHGEAFGEHGMLLHARQLYDELLRVPLVVRGPAPFQNPREVDASVGLTDLLPTFLDLIGAPALGAADGVSLRPALEAGAAGRPVVAEEVRTHYHTGGESVATLGSVRTARWKFVATYEMKDGTYVEELYDLVADPGEAENLVGAGDFAPAPSGDDPFCRAMERVRDQLWGTSDNIGFQQERQGYGSGLRSITRPRPAVPCAR
jgi:arylsulfatase A-like enzyme